MAVNSADRHRVDGRAGAVPPVSFRLLVAVSRSGTAALVALLALLAGGGPAMAQAPAPSTPAVVPRSDDLAPPRVEPSRPSLPPQPTAPRELGKPEDDLRLDVLRYEVDASAPAELAAALPGLTAAYVGKDRGFEDLVNAAAEVTRFLQRELGYYLGYAYIPEQAPAGGIVRIAVLEGRLDRVVLNWSAGLPVSREVVESYLARLQPGAILRVRDVERVVFLVNDLRGITARFEVRAGATPGTAQLVVTPRAESTFAGKVDLDTNGSRYLGRYRVGGLAQFNSPFGRGDGFAANVLASTTGGLAFALLGYNTPVGGDGFKLGLSLSGVRYELDKTVFPLLLNGTAVTGNAYGLYPLVRSRNLNLFALASWEQKAYTDRQDAAGAETKKSVQTGALGLTGDVRDSLLGGGVNTFELNAVSGRLRYADGRTVDDDMRFTKATVGFTRLQDVATGRVLAYLSLRGQWTRDNLDTTEQYRLGGPDGVRGYAPGEGTGDTGGVASLELRILPSEEWFGRAAREMVASVFYDAGWVRYRNRPSANSTLVNHDRFTSAGIGFAWVRGRDFALRLSVAQPIDGTPRSEPASNRPRMYFQATTFFN